MIIGFLIRAMGLDWDQGTFLHPDERFLVMVVQDLKLPDSLASYFSTDSPLQVRNTKHSFYVYGSFPVVITKLIAHWTIEQESFKNVTYLGRWITIILETLNIFLVFKLTEFLIKRYRLPAEASLWSSLLYALLVLPIQLSHFFTVDPFAVFFALLSLVFITKINDRFNKLWLTMAGVSLGLALASKLSVVFIGPILAVFMISLLWKKEQKLFKNLLYLSTNGLVFTLSFYLSLRFFNPEYFAFGSWLNPTISPTLIKSLEMLKHWSSPNASFPPAMQWLNRVPILFCLNNIFFFGLGVWSSLVVLIGVFFSLKNKPKSLVSWIIVWLTCYLVWQGKQFVQSLRYFYLLYPFFAVLGAIGISYLKQIPQVYKKEYIFNLVMLVILLIWPLMFINIFTLDHSRVQATYWIRENIEPTNQLLYEYWDDALPLAYAPGKNIRFETTPVAIFDQDTAKKWQTIEQQLTTANYYILSSNRGWASLSRLPEKYPTTTKFYEDLFAGKTSYQLEKMFQSSPSLHWLGINFSLDDSWSEEAFTVYDHPTVYIFKKY